MPTPATTRVLVLRKTPAAEGQATWHATALVDAPLPALQEGQVVVKVYAAGFNRRDVSRCSVLPAWRAR
jgi:NADPH:quinone reductase-like Zn-dependent oxidoreductase